MASEHGIYRRAAAAVGWGYAGTVLRMGAQLLAMGILARILPPDDFGAFALLLLIAGLMSLAADLTSGPLVTARDLSDETVRYAWNVQILCGLVAAACVWAACRWAPAFFQAGVTDTRAAWAMAIGTLGVFGGGVSQSILRRRMDYKVLQSSQLVGYLIGYFVVAIPLARHGGFGYAALAIAWAVQSWLSTALMLRAAPHALRPRGSAAAPPGFLALGLTIALGNVGNWVSNSADRLLVSKFASPAENGYYNGLLNVLLTPVHQLSTSVNSIAFTIGSRLDDEERRQSALAYFIVTLYLATLLYGVVIALPSPFVNLMYGARWLEAVPLVPLIALSAVAVALSSAAGSVGSANGMSRLVTVMQWVSAAAVAIAVALGLRVSLWTACVGLVLVAWVKAIWLTVQVARGLGIRWAPMARGFAACTGIGVFQVLVTRTATVHAGLEGPLPQLATAAVVGFLLAVATVRWHTRLFPAACWPLFGRLRAVLRRHG